MGRPSRRSVTKYLRELADEAETITDSGVTLTKAEVLARLLWKFALGWKETTYDPKTRRPIGVTDHSPAKWAIDIVYNRLEGQVPHQVVDESRILTAAEKVSELATERLNNAAEVAVTVSSDSDTVDGPNHGSKGAEGTDGKSSVEK